jgi:hypothetical protein
VSVQFSAYAAVVAAHANSIGVEANEGFCECCSSDDTAATVYCHTHSNYSLQLSACTRSGSSNFTAASNLVRLCGCMKSLVQLLHIMNTDYHAL